MRRSEDCGGLWTREEVRAAAKIEDAWTQSRRPLSQQHSRGVSTPKPTSDLIGGRASTTTVVAAAQLATERAAKLEQWPVREDAAEHRAKTLHSFGLEANREGDTATALACFELAVAQRYEARFALSAANMALSLSQQRGDCIDGRALREKAERLYRRVLSTPGLASWLADKAHAKLSDMLAEEAIGVVEVEALKGRPHHGGPPSPGGCFHGAMPGQPGA